MKRLICIVLAMLVLLCGCAKQQPQTEQPPEVTETTGLYDPDHPVEQQTAGAIRAYPLGASNYIGLRVMGGKLLLIRDDATALVLQGENGEIAAEGTLGITSMDDAIFDVDAQGVVIYRRETKQVVQLNPQLQEVNSYALPEDLQGDPVISLESNEIFYCRGGEIRALNMESGVPRLIKSHTVHDQTLLGCYFDGKVICCQVFDSEGAGSVLYLSAENGLTLSREQNVHTIETLGEQYFIQRTDNQVSQNIVGIRQKESKCLTMPISEQSYICEALLLDGVISYETTEAGLELLFHDLKQELTVASLTLPEHEIPVCVQTDDQFVWMIVTTGEGQVLYRWDPKLSPLNEPVSVVAPLYTAENPDTEGLATCQEQVDELNTTHGIQICIWQDAAKETSSYVVVPEYQPYVIRNMLEQLKPTLERFPEGFLKKTVRSGNVRIGLVRSISGDAPWVQYWKGGNCCILISSETDVGAALIEAIGYGIDSRVIGNSRDYDTWSKLNPDGFKYGAEQPADEEGNVQYLEGEERAFVCREAMENPTEDRRYLFIFAMGEDNAEVFASEYMQAKLRRMCEGIREAYDLEKEKVIFPWEQYLKEPMVEVEQTNG